MTGQERAAERELGGGQNVTAGTADCSTLSVARDHEVVKGPEDGAAASARAQFARADPWAVWGALKQHARDVAAQGRAQQAADDWASLPPRADELPEPPEDPGPPPQDEGGGGHGGEPPGRNGSGAAAQDRPKAKDKPAKRLPIVSGASIAAKSFGPVAWLAEGIVPAEGLTMLGGRPKVGKSWLALQLCCAVATGGMFLDQPVTQGRCLYLALEDSERRLHSRMRQQRWTAEAYAACDFVTVGGLRDLGYLNKPDGYAALCAAAEAGGYALIVVDTLSRALSGDQNAQRDMVAALAPLQTLAQERGIAIIVLDHFNKLGAANPYGGGPAQGIVEADPIQNLSGSIAKSGCADAILGLYKTQGRAGAQLVGDGRDYERPVELPLKFDGLLRCWQTAGEMGQSGVSDAKLDAVEALRALGEARLGELAKHLKRDRSNTRRDLLALVDEGVLYCRDGTYGLVDDHQADAGMSGLWDDDQEAA